jgi:hypothetical protein
MKKYLFKSFLFTIPIWLGFIFIFLIDPYEFINVSRIIDSESKYQVLRRSDESQPRGHMLWKTTHFERNPVKNILLGDSQGAGFDDSYISEISGEEYYNFCVTGASYETIFKIFWFATDKIKLEKVYFQVGFMNYNALRSYCIFHFAENYFQKPYLYFTTKEILFDSFYNFLYSITENKDLVQHSYEFLDVEKRDERSYEIMQMFFNEYSYPHEYYAELEKISNYCEENNIQLNFIIFPMYDGAKEYIANANLSEMNQRFKDDVKSLGHTYDFDKSTEFTKDRNNFIDYFHPIRSAYVDISNMIWGH